MSINNFKFKALGTEIENFLVSKKEIDKLEIEKIISEIEEIYRIKEKMLSRFSQGSELLKLNSNLRTWQNASEDILYLVDKSLEYWREYENYFDPRILEILEGVGYKKSFFDKEFGKQKGLEKKYSLKKELTKDLKIKNNQIYFECRMDFSGIAKGYITDLASAYLRKKGFNNFLVDSGGDIFASGKNEERENWKIEVEGIPKEKIILELKDEAVATSGITRRKWDIEGEKYHHLINPKSPYSFSFDLKSVTVMEKSCEKADVLAKILYIMGKEKGLAYSKEKNIASLFLDYKGIIYVSENMKKQIYEK